jgi:hypothetical protein
MKCGLGKILPGPTMGAKYSCKDFRGYAECRTDISFSLSFVEEGTYLS